LPSLSAWSNPVQGFNCFINSPANPDFAPSEASPQFVLDDALPSTIQVHAFSPINAAAAITNLHLFSMSLTNPANVTAESVASDGSSAVFPYPLAADGMALPAGPYITTITTDPTGSPQTTNGMEPIYIAHDDKSYTSAFGVDVAAPQEEVITIQNGEGCNGAPPTVTNTIYGGKGLPLVTLPTLGKLAVGSSSQTISVGTFPTSVIAYNNQVVENTTGTVGNCQSETIKVYTGSQSALVVNTGSNNVSLVNIGEYAYPTGTIAVGSSPVAATINPSGTLAYIANYGSGTISEINLQTVQVTRTLSVTTHPTSVAFDSNGNLWVGGQGYLQLINITNWSAGTAFSVDGTVTGMSYDVAQGEFVCMMLQNGTPSAPSNGNTRNHVVAYSPAGGVSYSTASMVNVATGNTVVGSSIASDSAPYAVSSLAPALAYPGQTAFNPPIYTSSSGDLMASANGNTFTVSVLSTGKVLISGAVPHPIRGVKLTPTMLYFTMSESNSLVSLPIQLP
jgi:YVTN family beta-propeller protein